MREKGFTLIELLVVISIIGLLSSIVLANLQSAKQKAEDAYTLLTVDQVRNALELYYEDHGKYPCHVYSTSADSNFLEPLVAGGYLGSAPQEKIYLNYDYQSVSMLGDPCGTGAMFGFTYTNSIASTTCPYGSWFISNSYAGTNVHCHLFIPQINSDCDPGGTNPQGSQPAGCPYGDSVNDY